MNRRKFLKAAGAAGGFHCLAAASAADAQVTLYPREAGAVISPRLHGQCAGSGGGSLPGRPGLGIEYHTYYRSTATRSASFTRDEWHGMLSAGRAIEAVIEREARARRRRLVIDEWGIWYPPGSELGPHCLSSRTITLREALHAALTLDIFHRHAEKLAAANLAQTAHCLGSLVLREGEKCVRTPIYHVFAMYLPHRGARAIPAALDASVLDGSASRREDRVTLTLVNPSLDADLRVTVALAGAAAREARATVLADPDVHAANTLACPERVAPKGLPVELAGGGIRMRLPRQSVAALSVRII